jgi:hypothetical protein
MSDKYLSKIPGYRPDPADATFAPIFGLDPQLDQLRDLQRENAMFRRQLHERNHHGNRRPQQETRFTS